jgi:3',5'-cyclic AMP phosphodiesterase CpdA
MTQKPVFTVAAINDAHVSSKGDETGARARLEATLQAIRADGVDLLLTLGDITHRPSAEDMGLAKQLLSPWPGATVLPLPGNHEVGIGDDARERAAYRRAFGEDRFTYASVFRGVLFVMIDNAAADTPWTPRLDARQRLLERLFDRHPSLPVVVAAHTPLVPMREEAALAASFAFYSWMSMDPLHRLRRLLERRGERIVAVLGGHLHLTSHVEAGGLHYIVPSGTYSWPNDYVQLQFYPDRVIVNMRRAPLPSRALGTMTHYPLANGIHDRQGSGQRLGDAGHPTPQSYLEGLECERASELVIPRKYHISTDPRGDEG